jgi:two-component system cell cycle sensor histidine kinase/response regulator CckA
MSAHPEILVVDDEPMVCTFMQRILENHGYRVSTAHNAADAMGILVNRNGDFRLLVTDVLMPNMTGPALASAAVRLFPELPVLYVSGYFDDDATCISAGACVPKPFTPAQFLSRVEAIVPKPPAVLLVQ